MKITETNLQGCFVLEPKIFEDKRGYFYEAFNKSHFEKITGENINIIQDNEAKSSYGVLRGLHFQLPPFSQAKLIRVLQGEILDVVVDLRKNSPTYGEHCKVILNDQNKKQFFVPRGFAHGYLVLSETATCMYKVDNTYAPEHDSGIMWNDKTLNIDWGIPETDLIISKKDENLQSFSAFESPF